ncbi:major facilitator superfamily domain-containing protein [Aspergillus undulatus]|uniref:major facilitator superfamily domain-containing protein n=1 Tax=Aspergillus undulatus TaxID=1810928 RepID=UPI003CCD0293
MALINETDKEKNDVIIPPPISNENLKPPGRSSRLCRSARKVRSSRDSPRVQARLVDHVYPVADVFLNYLDRNAIALARLNSLEADLNLSSTEYQTWVSILFVGYVIVGIPANMVVTRVRPSWWMSSCMAVWAIISALTALAPYYPGALYILATFYTRMSILYMGNILATAFAWLIALGIFQMDGMMLPPLLTITTLTFISQRGIADWRWLFIIQSAVTLAAAITGFFILPDEPLTTHWLTTDERALAHERTMADTVANAGKATTWNGLCEAAKDPKVWLFTAMQHCHLPANGFKNFFPTAVEMLGFNETITLVLTCPPYLIAGIISIVWSWSLGRLNERTWHITVAKTVAVFGFILGCATLNTGTRYFAMVTFSIGTYAVRVAFHFYPLPMSRRKARIWERLEEKKASSLAIVNCIAVASFIWTPYMWPTSNEPRYTMATSSSAALSVATGPGAWLMRVWLVWENRRIRGRWGADETVLYYAY